MDRLLSAVQRALDELFQGPRSLAFLEAAVSIVLIVVAAAIALRLAAVLVRRALAPRGEHFLDETRARTLQPLVESLLRYTIYFIALVMLLREAGVDATAVLASAGVVGLAVGFGAQHLIRDVISGFFLLAEGLVQVGDVITVAEHTGLVERIGVRATQLRKYNGELWTIPNGQLQVFGNLNRDYLRAIVEVPLSYGADLEKALAVMKRVGDEWSQAHREAVLGPPEVQAVTQFGDARVTLRLAVKVRPHAQPPAERELRRLLMPAFDREGVGEPFGRAAGEGGAGP